MPDSAGGVVSGLVSACIERWASSIVDDGGSDAYDALERAYLEDEDPTSLPSAPDQADRMLGMVLSTTLLFPVGDATGAFADGVERTASRELVESVRRSVDTGVLETRGIVHAHREEALAILRAHRNTLDEDDRESTAEELVESLIVILADSELHEQEDRAGRGMFSD